MWDEQLKQRYTAHAAKSWQKVFTFIVGLMSRGFDRWALEHLTSLADLSSTFSARPSTEGSFSSSSSDSESECMEFDPKRKKSGVGGSSKKTSRSRSFMPVPGKSQTLSAPSTSYACSIESTAGSSANVDEARAKGSHDSKHTSRVHKSSKSSKHKDTSPTISLEVPAHKRSVPGIVPRPVPVPAVVHAGSRPAGKEDKNLPAAASDKAPCKSTEADKKLATTSLDELSPPPALNRLDAVSSYTAVAVDGVRNAVAYFHKESL